jgi:rare lipoprotein A (peptidoglycan hydrolase)
MSVMKRILGTITLCLLVGSLSAQSVWTGNAAVGTSGDFPGESAVLRAASNSFPSGTELMVTNPRGGQSVEVTITGRLETPGVFILIERAAATAIDLPTDHVLPVRVTPLKAERALSPTAVATESDPLSDDSDYNPAVTLKDDIGEVRTAPAPAAAPETPETVEEPPVVVVPETVTPPEECSNDHCKRT